MTRAEIATSTDRAALDAAHLRAWQTHDLETQLRVLHRLGQLDGVTLRRMRDRRDADQKDADEEREFGGHW
jgi:hypothetical protein